MNELLRTSVKFLTPPQQWHPWLIHFPIVFMLLDAWFTMRFWFTQNNADAQRASTALTATLVALAVAIVAGLHDSGLDLGEGNRLWLGLQDRWTHAFRWRSTVTMHTWFALAVSGLALTRFLWRKLDPAALARRRLAYAGVLLLNLWVLLAAAHSGGSLNHN